MLLFLNTLNEEKVNHILATQDSKLSVLQEKIKIVQDCIDGKFSIFSYIMTIQ